MERISLFIGLILMGSGTCQVFEVPEISSENDLTASAATLFGPKLFGIRSANLGNFGPLGYGGIGGMRMGKIGPLHYGHIGGIHANSFLGASNPNSEEGESAGGTGTQFGENQKQQMNQYQQIVGNPMENGPGFDGPENIVGMQQNWQGIDGPSNFEQNYRGIDGDDNFVGMEQNWQGIDGPNFVGMEQNYQGIDGQENFVGMEQNWQGIDGANIVGMYRNYQGFDDQQNTLGMNPNDQGAWELGLSPQMPENSRAFLNDGLFGVKTDKLDKFEKIPPKPSPPPKFPKHPPKFTPPPPLPPPPPPTPPPPTPPPNYYGGYGSNSYGHSHGHNHGGSFGTGYRYGGHHHSHNSHSHGYNKFGNHHGHGHKHGFNKFGGHGHHSLFRSDAQEFQQNAPQGYEIDAQMQQFYQINNAVPLPASTAIYRQPYQPNIIFILYSPQSRQSSSARSSVDDVLTGLEDIGFDFEFRDLIENVFLAPYLGLLDPNDLIDDEDDAFLLV